MVNGVVVFGTGAYARALSQRLESCGITCVLGSRRGRGTGQADTSSSTPIDTTSTSTSSSIDTAAAAAACERIGSSLVLPYSSAITYGISLLDVDSSTSSSSSPDPLIIILAIPASGHSHIIDVIRHAHAARDQAPRQFILVDISNPTTLTSTSTCASICGRNRSTSQIHDEAEKSIAKKKHIKKTTTTTTVTQALNHVGSDLHTALLIKSDDLDVETHAQTTEETTATATATTTTTTFNPITSPIISRCQTSCGSRSRCSDQDHFTCMVEDVEDIKTGCSTEVSVTSPPPPALTCDLSYSEQLQHRLPMCHVVKAFNTISAYAISRPIGTNGDDRVLICGDSREMKAHVAEMISTIGMIPIHAGRLMMTRDLERRSMQLFQQWHGGTFIAIIWMIVATTYVAVRDFVIEPQSSGQQDKDWYDLFLLKWNIIIAWHSILCFTTVYGVGLIAAIFQLVRGTIRQTFPRWLDVTLRARKSLGIYGLASAIIHCIAALCTNPLFIDFSFIQSNNGNLYQISIFLAMCALLLFGTLGVSSIAGVANTLSWREWTFVQSKIGYVAYAVATGHILLISMSVDAIFVRPFVSWRDYFLPVSALAAGGACLLLLVKMMLTFTPLASRLHRIRTGAAKQQDADDT